MVLGPHRFGMRGFVVATVVFSVWAATANGQTFSDCGVVERGVECLFFRPDHEPGSIYLVDGNLFCPVGTRICVTGTLWPDCGSPCLEGNGCIIDSVVTPRCRCPCDWDYSGAVCSQDFFRFLDDFFAGAADENFDGTTDSQDVFDFLRCFTEGFCL